MLRVFDFECQACGKVEEHPTRCSEAEGWTDVKCSCGSTDVKRIFSSPADAKGLSHDGLGLKVPDAFKQLINQTMKTVPTHARGKGQTLW